ncbi:hypothetical protein Bca101_015035 [Brassica carinata]
MWLSLWSKEEAMEMKTTLKSKGELDFYVFPRTKREHDKEHGVNFKREELRAKAGCTSLVIVPTYRDLSDHIFSI